MKVTRQVYKEIKARLQEAPGYTQKEVAKMVGVAQSTVDRVVKSRNYKNYHELIKEHNLQQAKRKEYQAYQALPNVFQIEKAITTEVSPSNKNYAEYERKRVKTEIKGHLRDIYSLLKLL